jgi:outer membrane protein assembly factor BamD
LTKQAYFSKTRVSVTRWVAGHTNRRCAAALGLAVALSLSGCAGTVESDETVNWTPEKLYQSAKSDMNQGSYDAAIKTLNKLESRYPFGKWSQQSQLDQAYAKYKLQEMPEALVAVDRFMRLHPGHESTDYALYLKGLINFNENQGFFAAVGRQDLSERDLKAAKDAYDVFKDLVTRFPQSRYAPESRQRMNYLVNSIAAGEVHVARYYFRRGAFVAASNRAKEVVRGYSDAPAIEEALYIMARSYKELGINDLAADAERVLKQNYPQSAYLSGGTGASGASWWQIWK